MTYWESIRGKDGVLSWKTFDKYNLSKAVDHFDPEEKGARDAIRHSPDIDGRELTASETEMVNHVQDHLLELSQFVNRELDDADQKVHKVAELGLPEVEAENIKITSTTTVNNRRANLRSSLRPIVTELDQAKRFLNFFRYKNDLSHRPAVYPDNSTYELGLLAVLLIAEAIVNSIFFAHGSDLGLLGGWMEALLVSLANVSTSFIAGFLCLRYTQHKSVVKKTMGATGFFLAILCISFLHLATAHYRELVIRSSDASFSDVIASTINNPFGITDLYSLILILVGVGISIFACYKGLNFDDHYPGYGKIWRRYAKLKDDSEEEIKSYRENLLTLQYDSIKELDKIRKNINESKEALKMIETDVEAFMLDYDTRVEQARLAAETLVSKYRSAYQKIIDRDDIMNVSDVDIQIGSTGACFTHAKEVRKAVGDLRARVELNEEAFIAKYDVVVSHIQKIFSDMSDDQAIKKVENEVLASVRKEFDVNGNIELNAG